jgi:hypothetical protein
LLEGRVERKFPDVIAIEPSLDGKGVTLHLEGHDPISSVCAELRRLAHEIETGDAILINAIVTAERVECNFRKRYPEGYDA